MSLSLDIIEKGIRQMSAEYPIKKVTLFGSYADGSSTEDSDIDLLVEFHTRSVSLFTLSGLKIGLEEIFDKNVDVLHAPLPDDTMIEIGKALVIYESQGLYHSGKDHKRDRDRR